MHFQKVINEWQAIHDLSLAECQYHRRDTQKDKERFVRRMANSVGGSANRENISLWGHAEDDGKSPPDQIKDQSVLIDEPEEEQTIRQNMLR